MKTLLRSLSLAVAFGAGFVPLATTPSPADAQQVCSVFCATSQCSSNSDCTAAPNGRCDFACPKIGCCVYQ